MENRLTIAGTAAETPQTRFSPAGIPIARFVLHHLSVQREGGMEREARVRVTVVAAGEELQAQVAAVEAGALVQVSGFLTHPGGRAAPTSLVLHAECIQRL